VYGCDAGGLLWLIFLFFLLLGSIFLPSHEAQHLFKDDDELNINPPTPCQ
jgi:hypothetical protein